MSKTCTSRIVCKCFSREVKSGRVKCKFWCSVLVTQSLKEELCSSVWGMQPGPKPPKRHGKITAMPKPKQVVCSFSACAQQRSRVRMPCLAFSASPRGLNEFCPGGLTAPAYPQRNPVSYGYLAWLERCPDAQSARQDRRHCLQPLWGKRGSWEQGLCVKEP